MNNPDAKFCQKCGLALDEKVAMEKERKEKLGENDHGKLCKLASLDFETVLDNVIELLPSNWGQCLGNSERIGEITKEVNFPDLTNPRIAELIGAFLGDGYLFEY